jgi:tRNA-binding protein
VEAEDRLRGGDRPQARLAQITHYPAEELEGGLIVAVVNFPPRQIGPFRSGVLVLGALDPERGVVLLRPDQEAALGSRIA